MDLSDSAAILIDNETLRKYLESKYFSLMNKEVEQSILRSLWKIVFRLTDPECERNRSINFRALALLIKRNDRDIISLIKSEQDYYSNIASDGSPLYYLVIILSKKPEIYHELKDDCKVIINHYVNTNIIAKCLGWFIRDTLEAHYEYLKIWIENEPFPSLTDDSIKGLRQISDSREWESLRTKLMNSYYAASINYDTADERFEKAIRPYIDEYGRDELIDFLEKFRRNAQTYTRRHALYDHSLIKSKCDDVLGRDFDYSPYPEF